MNYFPNNTNPWLKIIKKKNHIKYVPPYFRNEEIVRWALKRKCYLPHYSTEKYEIPLLLELYPKKLIENLVGNTISGSTFNYFFSKGKFYKWIDEKGIHHGIDMRSNDLIIEPKQLQEQSNYEGKIYFTEKENLTYWRRGRKFYRKVIIPNYAWVRIEKKRFGTNKLLLREWFINSRKED